MTDIVRWEIFLFFFTLITVRKYFRQKYFKPAVFIWFEWYKVHNFVFIERRGGKMKKNFIDGKIPFHFSQILYEKYVTWAKFLVLVQLSNCMCCTEDVTIKTKLMTSPIDRSTMFVVFVENERVSERA